MAAQPRQADDLDFVPHEAAREALSLALNAARDPVAILRRATAERGADCIVAGIYRHRTCT